MLTITELEEKKKKRCLHYCTNSIVITPAISLKDHFYWFLSTAHALKSCEKVRENVGKVFFIKGNSGGDICLLRHCWKCSVGPDRRVFFTSQSFSWQQMICRAWADLTMQTEKKNTFLCLYRFYKELHNAENRQMK